MVEEARRCSTFLHRVKTTRNSWLVVVLLVTMIASTLGLRRGVASAFVALPKRGGERCFARHQVPWSLSLRGNRVERVPYQHCCSALYSSSSSLAAKVTYECIFELLLPEGRCVGLQLADLPDDHPDALVAHNIAIKDSCKAHWIYDCLHPDEIDYGMALQSDSRRKSFWVGRLAIRQALIDVQQEKLSDLSTISNSSILKDLHGRPKLPTGFLGSISHKGSTGVALVASIDDVDCNGSLPGVGIGVDLEEATSNSKRRSVARRILTPSEQADLGRIPVSIYSTL
jgi:4'-phosphopantetheinyl transferase EntD